MAVKTSEVAKILNASPNLPILCMVDGELCADDSCRRWAGCIGSAEVKEYVCLDPDTDFNTYGQAIFWKEDADDLVDLMCDSATDEEYEEASKAAVERVANMNWKKAIVLYIDLPEEDNG